MRGAVDTPATLVIEGHGGTRYVRITEWATGRTCRTTCSGYGWRHHLARAWADGEIAGDATYVDLRGCNDVAALVRLPIDGPPDMEPRTIDRMFTGTVPYTPGDDIRSLDTVSPDVWLELAQAVPGVTVKPFAQYANEQEHQHA